jgi:putative transposase
MGLGDQLMKLLVQVEDAVALAVHFEASPVEAMRQLVAHVQQGAKEVLERVMDAEIGIFLGRDGDPDNKRNGYTTRSFAFKGLGCIQVRVPRDRAGRFESRIVPKGRRYAEAIEKDLALLHLAGLSTRTLAHVSRNVLGIRVSPQEVSNSLDAILPAARAFLERPLGDRRYKYLYVDGTNFHVRRTTVAREPTLVVVGVDLDDRKSVLAMVQGDKDSRGAWEMVFHRLKERGLDGSAVQLGIMDGLPGLAQAFLEAFPGAKVARCWIHKARNVFPLVPKRYQAEFATNWDAVAYAESYDAALNAFIMLQERWCDVAGDAVESMERDLETLLVHYTFPQAHWDALRTTNPIERVNKEFKRRSKAMETLGPDTLKALLAFTAMRLEFGWATTPITSAKLRNMKVMNTKRRETQLDAVTRGLLN